MESNNAPSLTLYDFTCAPPARTYAPNMWKSRYALNYKGVPYTTAWTKLASIPELCKSLGLAANRTHADGSPYHTLPVLQDHQHEKSFGDSFEIALYLDATYPDVPLLFVPGTIGLTAAFNSQVDGIFTKHVGLCSGIPFPSEEVEEIISIFTKRAASNPAPMSPPTTAEEREALLLSLEKDLELLKGAYGHVGGTTDYLLHPGQCGFKQQFVKKEIGPWLDGDVPRYGDFIVGGWLGFFRESLPKDEWSRVREFQGGLWGRIHEALEPWREIK